MLSGGEERLGHRLVGGGGAGETKARDDSFGTHGHEQPESLVPPQPIGPSDVGVTRKPSRASALGVPDDHRRAVQGFGVDPPPPERGVEGAPAATMRRLEAQVSGGRDGGVRGEDGVGEFE